MKFLSIINLYNDNIFLVLEPKRHLVLLCTWAITMAPELRGGNAS